MPLISESNLVEPLFSHYINRLNDLQQHEIPSTPYSLAYSRYNCRRNAAISFPAAVLQDLASLDSDRNGILTAQELKAMVADQPPIPAGGLSVVELQRKVAQILSTPVTKCSQCVPDFAFGGKPAGFNSCSLKSAEPLIPNLECSIIGSVARPSNSVGLGKRSIIRRQFGEVTIPVLFMWGMLTIAFSEKNIRTVGRGQGKSPGCRRLLHSSTNKRNPQR